MVSGFLVRHIYALSIFWCFIVVSSAAEAQDILLSPNFCRDSAEYQPVDDIIVRPGQGKNAVLVTSPNLDSAGQDIADGIVANTLRVQLTADVALRLGIQSPEEVDMEAPLGTLVYRSGRVYFNDFPVDDIDGSTVRTLCRSAVR